MTISLLQSLGFLINEPKSTLCPSQTMDFLGFVTDSQTAQLILPKTKLRDLKKEIIAILNKQLVSLRSIVRVVGLLASSIQAIFPGPLSGSSETKDSTSPERSILHRSSSVVSRSTRGDAMVAGPRGSVERQSNFRFTTRSYHRIRRQPLGPGSTLWRYLHRRKMVFSRVISPHQLPGVTSMLLHNPNVISQAGLVLYPT